jgi:hypothetical protein
MGQLQFSELQVTPLASDAAFVRGAWTLTMKDGKTPYGLFTLLFRKFPDGWSCARPHVGRSELFLHPHLYARAFRQGTIQNFHHTVRDNPLVFLRRRQTR